MPSALGKVGVAFQLFNLPHSFRHLSKPASHILSSHQTRNTTTFAPLGCNQPGTHRSVPQMICDIPSLHCPIIPRLSTTTQGMLSTKTQPLHLLWEETATHQTVNYSTFPSSSTLACKQTPSPPGCPQTRNLFGEAESVPVYAQFKGLISLVPAAAGYTC